MHPAKHTKQFKRHLPKIPKRSKKKTTRSDFKGAQNQSNRNKQEEERVHHHTNGLMLRTVQSTTSANGSKFGFFSSSPEAWIRGPKLRPQGSGNESAKGMKRSEAGICSPWRSWCCERRRRWRSIWAVPSRWSAGSPSAPRAHRPGLPPRAALSRAYQKALKTRAPIRRDLEMRTRDLRGPSPWEPEQKSVSKPISVKIERVPEAACKRRAHLMSRPVEMVVGPFHSTYLMSGVVIWICCAR